MKKNKLLFGSIPMVKSCYSRLVWLMKSDLIHHVCSWRKLGDWILHKVHVLNLEPAYHLKYRKKKKIFFFYFIYVGRSAFT